jgi:hypothetical protein
MKRQRCLLTFCCLAVILSGCGDSPSVIIRDSITVLTELADVRYLISDDLESAEDSAQANYTRIMRLKEKWTEVKKRIEGLAKLDKDRHEEAWEALAEAAPRAKLALQYDGGSKVRLRGILNKLAMEVREKEGPQVAIDEAKRWPFLFKSWKADEMFTGPTSIGPPRRVK